MGLEYSTTTGTSSLLFVAKGEHSEIEPDATHYRAAQKQLKLQEENHHQRKRERRRHRQTPSSL